MAAMLLLLLFFGVFFHTVDVIAEKFMDSSKRLCLVFYCLVNQHGSLIFYHFVYDIISTILGDSSKKKLCQPVSSWILSNQTPWGSARKIRPLCIGWEKYIILLRKTRLLINHNWIPKNNMQRFKMFDNSIYTRLQNIRDTTRALIGLRPC